MYPSGNLSGSPGEAASAGFKIADDEGRAPTYANIRSDYNHLGNIKPMKVVILAGGKGTRISEESHIRPKPMIEIGGKPILWHIMKFYSHYQLNDFVICCGYRGYVLKEYFANYFLHNADVTFDLKQNRMEVHSKYGDPWRVTLVDTGEETMTGGRLKRVREFLKDEEFCFTYGDGLCDVNITTLIEFHRKQGRLATITAVRPPGRFGALEIQGGMVSQFAEKPAGGGGLINGGFFVLSPRVIDFISDDRTIWEREPMEQLCAQGQLAAFEHHGFWQPMDTLREKLQLEDLWSGGRAPWKVLGGMSFWRGRRVFLTGHTGFKGAWLALWLHSLGAKVTGFALPVEGTPNLFSLLKLDTQIDSLHGDIRDLAGVENALERSQPEVVLHLAAQALVRRSYREPVETYATNVLGTVHVLDAIRRCAPQVRAVVVVTSDKCYENEDSAQALHEDSRLGGHDPYSSSKGCAELVCASYRDSFFKDSQTRIASARAGNVIGGGDWAEDRLIPDIIKTCLNKEEVVIRNPRSTRPWQHVLEPLAAYMLLAERLASDAQGEYCGAWNIGPDAGDEKTVQQVVEHIATLWPEVRWRVDASNGPQVHEAHFLRLDSQQIRARLGWKPRLSTHEALAWTVAWYRACARLDAAEARAQTLAQIAEYKRKLEGP